jgi:hypothetical protein
MQTLLLDQVAWDLVLTNAGNIAVASDPYSQAQDVASSIKLFEGELWYDTTVGVPYFGPKFQGGGLTGDILGYAPPLNYVRQLWQKAALLVPGVVKASVFFSGFSNRVLSGQVQVANSNSQSTSVNVG